MIAKKKLKNEKRKKAVPPTSTVKAPAMVAVKAPAVVAKKALAVVTVKAPAVATKKNDAKKDAPSPAPVQDVQTS